MLAEKESPGLDLADHETVVRHFANLVFLSFKFSQANDDFQVSIFAYLKFFYPGFYIDNQLKEDILDAAYRPAVQYAEARDGRLGLVHTTEIADKQYLINKGFIAGNLSKHASLLQTMFDNPRPSKEHYPCILAEDTIKQDLYYIGRKGGRVRVPPLGANPLGFAWDPWASFLQHYAIEGNPTGAWEYNQMFQEISDYILTLRGKKGGFTTEEKDCRVNLRKLVRLWEKKHPGRDFFAGRLNRMIRDR